MNTTVMTPKQEALRRRLARIARLMDSSIRVPLIGKRIGWDAVIGLVPGIGDLLGAAISGYIVLAARDLDVPGRHRVRMLMNIGIETVLGAVPVLGDLFDMAFRANERNVALIERHLAKTAPDAQPSVPYPPRDGASPLVLFALGLGSVIAAGALASRLLASGL